MQGTSVRIVCAIAALVVLGSFEAQAFAGKKSKPTPGKKSMVKEAEPPTGLGLEGVVNINTASHDELELLPGIGPTRSKAIVAYRVKRPFKDPRHLLRVKGIGRRTLHRILPFLVVKGPTTLKKK
jgi:competence protein ComEA